MTTAATSLLGIALPVTGELSGTWGDTVNNSISSLLDSAIAGTTTLSADADVTLTTTTLSANQARQAIILWTAGGTVTRTITAPAQSKPYIVINKTSSTQSIIFIGATGAGVTLVAGEKAVVSWNGVDFVKVANQNGTGNFTSLITTDNVGVGVTPSAWSQGKAIEIYQAGYGFWNGISSSYVVANAYYNSGFKYGATAQASHYYQYQGQHVWSNAPSGTAGNAITFTQAMTLDASGNLGIGTASPGARLDIVTGANNRLRVSESGSTLYFDSLNAAASAWLPKIERATQLQWNTAASGTPTLAMLLDSSGNLGLGVTPSAWGSNFKAVQVGRGTALWSGTATDATFLSQNAYYDGTNFKYLQTSYASYYSSQLGQHLWYNAPSGTAGNNITFTQAMMLDNSGNLLVGTTTASGKITAAVANNASYQAAAVFTNLINADFIVSLKTNSTQIGPSTATPLAFATGSTEKMRIDSSGRLLVGTTSAGNMNGRVIAANATGTSSIGTVVANGTGAVDTGIPINQTDGGGCIVLVASRNTSGGTNTDAAVYIVRFYFDGNNAPTTVYVGGSSNFVTFGVSGSNTLTLINGGGGNAYYSWFGNK
jgi:hypothetical protein